MARSRKGAARQCSVDEAVPERHPGTAAGQRITDLGQVPRQPRETVRIEEEFAIADAVAIWQDEERRRPISGVDDVGVAALKACREESHAVFVAERQLEVLRPGQAAA